MKIRISFVWTVCAVMLLFSASAKGSPIPLQGRSRLPHTVASHTGRTGEFSIGCVNCGAFHYGKGKATPEAFAATWRKMAADWPQDVFFYEDVGKGTPGNVSQPRLDIRAAAKEPPAAVDVVELPRSIETDKGLQKSPRYRVLRLTYNRDGKTLAVYGGHLVAEGHIRGAKPAKGEPSFSQRLRQTQFKALIEDAKHFDYAILTGDFNAQVTWEYDVFRQAGFSIANCSETYGTQATLRNIPADNIILSPGLSFADFKVLRDYVLDTDHFPLVATVRFADAPSIAPVSVPSVEEFLEKPAAERRALFKDPAFRQKAFRANYPDGKGLLSRWVHVEKIPNLRDVGGLVNKDGQELRRGVFYRSAGWNDNAAIDRKKPESEWRKGKSRLSGAGRKVVQEKLCLKTDLDLRSDSECWGMTESPIGKGVLWKHVPFGHYDEFEKKPAFKAAVKEVFATLADPSRRPLVFHCIGGADRTGCLAYFIQALCDVDDDTLVKDWELTCCYTARPTFVHEKGMDRLLAMLSKYPGSTMKARVAAFLSSCGVTDAEMAAVRAALVP